ncbi:Putative nuclease HARBI1 [Trachymyrmex cornetzi]|uniref:Putative nuclease HARBI1 n=1 Tax=Trachymyrmex cornetzi TaxID=471704 RepID=A0A151JRD0_9HYME|nr:Putative nuclease HARBI1 [Trachymyrmex cornetzi]
MANIAMCAILEEEERVHMEEKRALKLKWRFLRDVSNPFSTPENEFRQMYRLSRECARNLIEQLEPYMENVVNATAIPLHLNFIYINRKLYHSLNVLLVCDFEMKIRTINALNGGRTHDARVFRASQLYDNLNTMTVNGEKGSWILGDSGYPLMSNLKTLKLHEPEGSPSARYTEHHVRARSTIERCIGLWKGRWRCLRKDRTLHYTPEKAG